MEKIVILAGRPGPDNALVELIGMVFPDCEVCVVFNTLEEAPDEVMAKPYSTEGGKGQWPGF